MQLRITVTQEDGGTLVRVDGWLAEEGIQELSCVLSTAAARVRLLVEDLRGADAAGVAGLRRLADRGVPIEGLSPYIRLLLARQAPVAASAVPAPDDPVTPVRREDT